MSWSATSSANGPSRASFQAVAFLAPQLGDQEPLAGRGRHVIAHDRPRDGHGHAKPRFIALDRDRLDFRRVLGVPRAEHGEIGLARPCADSPTCSRTRRPCRRPSSSAPRSTCCTRPRRTSSSVVGRAACGAWSQQRERELRERGGKALSLQREPHGDRHQHRHGVAAVQTRGVAPLADRVDRGLIQQRHGPDHTQLRHASGRCRAPPP